tara:strand:+ start:924 stop:1382 length:459 start_codon:yes stop_codon:yes gene_type:complete
MAAQGDLNARMIEFLTDIGDAMGLQLTVTTEALDDATRVSIAGDRCDVFLQNKGEGLEALQHLVNAAFRRDHPSGRIVIDCLDYRRGQDSELRETAIVLANRALQTGESQEVGPLNPYARRIVHLAVADITDVSSESVGDAFMKTVVISPGE